MKTFQLCQQVSYEESGTRLDSWIGNKLQISRQSVQKHLKTFGVKVNSLIVHKPSYSLKPLETVELNWEASEQSLWEEVPGELDIVYEDERLICLNKPSGLVMYPGAGQEQESLLQRLLAAMPQLKNLPRYGLIHRLDKETSGLVVFAKTPQAHKSLLEIWFQRKVQKTYNCICHGSPAIQNIDKPIGRHPVHRKKMAVVASGKPAFSEILATSSYGSIALCTIAIHTGRMHQIRVHLSSLGHPILGDKVYGNNKKDKQATQLEIPHQLLHASSLKFQLDGEDMEFSRLEPSIFDLVLGRLG